MAMGLKELDFITYIRELVPTVIKQRKLKKTQKLKLVKTLAINIGKLRDHDDIRITLGRLPIILCENNEFKPATSVWFDNEVVREVLGNDTNFAKLPNKRAEALKEFYKWIGVSEKPLPKDIVNRIEELVRNPPNKTVIITIETLVRFIGTNWHKWDVFEKDSLRRLRNLPWLPVKKDDSKWYYPKDVNSNYLSYLFESQGNFLKFEPKTENTANVGAFFNILDIASKPTPEQVVKHLLCSIKKNQSIKDQIYEFLNDHYEDPSISMLNGEKCLYLGTIDGPKEYFSPNQVFWDEHPFGKFRHRLASGYLKYKDLFHSIGVKERPDASDAISVLLEIADEFGENNVSLKENSDEESVLLNCWKIISSAMETEEISKEEIEEKLNGQKIIPDPRNILTVPERMFFEDKPEWTMKFQLVKNNVIPKIEGAWEGMAAAGVSNLSDVIKTNLLECKNQINDLDLKQKVIDREDLFIRIKEANKDTTPRETNFDRVKEINYINSDQIIVSYTFFGFGKEELSEPEMVDAISIKDNLYFSTVDGNYPWLHIGRELSSIIDPTGKLKLGFEIREILSQPIDEANKALNESGFPLIESRRGKKVESQVFVTSSQEPDSESLQADMEFLDSDIKEKVHGDQDQEVVKERDEIRRNQREVSYQGLQEIGHLAEKRKNPD